MRFLRRRVCFSLLGLRFRGHQKRSRKYRRPFRRPRRGRAGFHCDFARGRSSFVSSNGAFVCSLPDGARLVVAAPGFATQTISAGDSHGPHYGAVADCARGGSVRVAGLPRSMPLSEQGSSLDSGAAPGNRGAQ